MTKREFVLRFVYKNLAVPAFNPLDGKTIDKIISEAITVYDRCEEQLAKDAEPEPGAEPDLKGEEYTIKYNDRHFRIEVTFVYDASTDKYKIIFVVVDDHKLSYIPERGSAPGELLHAKIMEYLRKL